MQGIQILVQISIQFMQEIWSYHFPDLCSELSFVLKSDCQPIVRDTNLTNILKVIGMRDPINHLPCFPWLDSWYEDSLCAVPKTGLVFPAPQSAYRHLRSRRRRVEWGWKLEFYAGTPSTHHTYEGGGWYFELTKAVHITHKLTISHVRTHCIQGIRVGF